MIWQPAGECGWRANRSRNTSSAVGVLTKNFFFSLEKESSKDFSFSSLSDQYIVIGLHVLNVNVNIPSSAAEPNGGAV